MNEFVTYVLLSPATGKTYTGYTSDLLNRMRSHNHFGKSGYTLRYRPWIAIYVKFFREKREALQHELELKSGKGRGFIRDHVLSKQKKISSFATG